MWTISKLIRKNSTSRRLFCTISIPSSKWANENCASENIQPYKLIPGPQPLPLVGNTWRFLPFVGAFQIQHIDKVSTELYRKYGKIVKISGLLGRPDMIFLFDPDDIEKVYRHEDTMPLRPSMPSLNYYKHVYRSSEFSQYPGVIAVHGRPWQKFRSKVNQVLLQPRVAQMYVQSIGKIAEELVNRIHTIKNGSNEVPDDFLNELHKWSLESIGKVALDIRLGSLSSKPNPETQQLIDAVQTFFISVPILELKMPFWRLWKTPTFHKYLNALDTIRKITRRHVENAFDIYRVNSDECGNSRKPISILEKVLKLDSNQELASNLALDMFLVGIDTTSNALASILYQLAIHKEKQSILHDEITANLPDFSTAITYEKLEQMVYLKACIKETMRMFPVVIGNGRCTTSDCVIRNYRIPQGVHIIFQHYVVSNLDEYFPDSSSFLPERWLTDSATNCRKTSSHHPFASLPFGYGKRMCLGRRIADLELSITVAAILRRYHLEYHHSNLDYHIHPMYTPNGPLLLRFIEKNLK